MSRTRRAFFGLGVLFTLLATAGIALAEEGAAGPDALGAAMDILIKVFVLATVLEMAFTTIFNWKFFLERFHDKGWKTPIMVIVIFSLCRTGDLHLFSLIITELFGTGHPVNINVDCALSALLLAGGSGGINTLFTKLKMRDPNAVQQRADQLQTALKERQAAKV